MAFNCESKEVQGYKYKIINFSDMIYGPGNCMSAVRETDIDRLDCLYR